MVPFSIYLLELNRASDTPFMVNLANCLKVVVILRVRAIDACARNIKLPPIYHFYFSILKYLCIFAVVLIQSSLLWNINFLNLFLSSDLFLYWWLFVFFSGFYWLYFV